MPMNVRDLDKLIVAKGFKSCPKSNKSPNLITLSVTPLTTELHAWVKRVEAGDGDVDGREPLTDDNEQQRWWRMNKGGGDAARRKLNVSNE